MTNPKYNPAKNGKTIGNRFPPRDPVTGLYLLHGNGCGEGGNNCFVCALPDCRWNESNHSNEATLSRRQVNVSAMG
jgi:hypothetical protein